jgi:Holliday junction DNA helicase RuvB
MGDIRGYLKENPDYIDAVKKILEWEKNNPQEDDIRLEGEEYDRRWKSTDVGVHGSKLYQLTLGGVIEKVYDSSSKTAYALVDRERTEEVLDELTLSDDQIRGDVPKEIHSFPDEDELPDDLFNDVIGYDDVKWLLRRGISTGDITNFLLVGPPGSAKTVFLRCVSRLEDAEFIPSTDATSVGFTEVLFESRPKYMLFDELDDMNKEEQKSLSSYTETGIVRETKHGKQRQMKTNTKTLASANATEPILDHIVDRFTVLEFDAYTRSEYLEVCRHILPQEEDVTEAEADKVGRAIWSRKGEGDVRQAIQIARLSDGDPDRVIDVIDKYSSESSGLEGIM